jgi:hypothetical protein
MNEKEIFEDLEEFDDFDGELNEVEGQDETEDESEFEGSFAIELTNLHHRTAVLTKNNMIALLGVQTFDQGGTICRVDPRDGKPAMQIYDNPADALDWFKRSLRTSRKNGWQVVYDGLPLHG